MRFFVYLILFFMLNPTAVAQDIRLGIHSNYKNDLLQIGQFPTVFKNKLSIDHCLNLDAPALKNIQRITMEILIICHAIKTTGIGTSLTFIPYPNVTRGIHQLVSGQTDMVAQSLFTTDHDENILFTQPSIRKGEFEVGVFTTPNRADMMNVTTLETLQQKIGVTVSSWRTDRNMMETLGIEKVTLTAKRQQMSKIIQHRRADFTFSYLKEKRVTRIGGVLQRIPGIKVSFPFVRAFAVSPKRKDLWMALEKTLIDLRRKSPDALRQAYIHAGFISPAYAHWRDLTKEAGY